MISAIRATERQSRLGESFAPAFHVLVRSPKARRFQQPMSRLSASLAGAPARTTFRRPASPLPTAAGSGLIPVSENAAGQPEKDLTYDTIAIYRLRIDTRSIRSCRPHTESGSTPCVPTTPQNLAARPIAVADEDMQISASAVSSAPASAAPALSAPA